MTRKQLLLITLAALLGGVSLYLNKDWFAKDDIQIFHRCLPARAGLFRRNRRPDDSAVEPVLFGFNRKFKLTSLKVIPVNDLETNKYPHPIWHLVSDSNSVPVKEIVYGVRVAGMHPEVKGATADPLEPGVTYRLLVQAGPLKAEHDFVPVAQTP